jgi:regulator of sigma E protease
MLTFIIVFLGLSFLILGHEAGHFLVSKLFKLRVDEFGIGFPPRMFAWKKGETEYSVNWLPFGGFVKIAGENDHMDKETAAMNPAAAAADDKKRYFFARPAWQRALVLFAGVAVNFLIGWLFLTIVFTIGTRPILAIQNVDMNSPAANAGVEAGDIIQHYEHVGDFIAYIKSHPNDAVQFTVLRDNKEISFDVRPYVQDGTARIGVALTEGGGEKQSIFQAAKQGLIASGQVCWLTLTSFYLLVKNLFLHASLLEGVVGPVGIFVVAEQTSRFGFAYLLQLLGFISLNLAVANLIPFPALDGGRLFFLAVEKIKGSPLSKKVEMWANGVGFALLIGIMILVTIRDVAHWF